MITTMLRFLLVALLAAPLIGAAQAQTALQAPSAAVTAYDCVQFVDKLHATSAKVRCGGGVNVMSPPFNAPTNGTSDSLAAFAAAIAAAPGGVVRASNNATNTYYLSGGIVLGGTGKAKQIVCDPGVVLKFNTLNASTDAVTFLQDQFAGIIGCTIDMGNPGYGIDATNTVYSIGRDCIRVKAGDHFQWKGAAINCGRDGLHYEPAASFDWLENLVAPDCLVDNVGRDGVHFEITDGFDAVFANELDFQACEIRGAKRYQIYAEQANLTYAAAKISNVNWPKVNLDARRTVVNLDATCLVYFNHTVGAPAGEFDSWSFGNGGWENTVGLMSNTHAICGDGAASVRFLHAGPGLTLYNIAASGGNAAVDRLLDYSILSGNCWVFDNIAPTVFCGGIALGDKTDTLFARLSAGIAGINGVPLLTSAAAAVQTFLNTQSSANARAMMSDESGTGAQLYQNGDLGTPSAAVLTNATALPIATGVSGLGTGIATALAATPTGTGGIVLKDSPIFTTQLTVPKLLDASSTYGFTLNTGSVSVADVHSSMLIRDGAAAYATIGSISGSGVVTPGYLMAGSNTALTLAAGAIGAKTVTASATAPGAAGAKLEFRCGTNAGTAKLMAYAGTSSTGVLVLDNIGAGVTGC